MRRTRRHAWLRRLVGENRLSADDFIWPIFVQEGAGLRTPIPSMPGVERLSIDRLIEAVAEAGDLGIPAIALPRPRHVAEIRFEPRFVELYRDIWENLRDEVLLSYERAKSSAGS